MITIQSVFRHNLEEVAAKVIDDELIIVRLSDGTYYSMRNVGTRIWELIEAGHDLDSIVRTLSVCYDRPTEEVSGDVESLLHVLLDEKLIAVTTHENGAGARIAAPSGPSATAYEKPRVDIYRDMGNLLALDPPTPGIDDLMFRSSKAK